MHRKYLAEPDCFWHAPAEKLVCERIDIEGWKNQRTVLSVPVVRLRPFHNYDIAIRQPIPSDAAGLPLWVKAIADIAFIPNISVGHGRADEVHREFEEVIPLGDGLDQDGIEVITEHVEAKMFRVQIGKGANQAFGNDLIFRNNEPYPFVRLYLNDVNEFMLFLPPSERPHHPRRLVRKRVEVLHEPIQTHSLGVNRSVTEFVHPSRHESSEVWVEGSFRGNHWPR